MEIIKCLIYILLFVSSTTIGFLMSKKYEKRVQQLKDFKFALTIFKTKIRFTYAPLKDIFEDISKSISSKTSQVFKLVSECLEVENATNCWDRALNDIELEITNEDKETIRPLGKLLGKTDLEGQLSEIDLCLTFLEKQIEKSEMERDKNSKLYKTLGSIAGIGIIIILL